MILVPIVNNRLAVKLVERRARKKKPTPQEWNIGTSSRHCNLLRTQLGAKNFPY
jgi:hypothetical protein